VTFRFPRKSCPPFVSRLPFSPLRSFDGTARALCALAVSPPFFVPKSCLHDFSGLEEFDNVDVESTAATRSPALPDDLISRAEAENVFDLAVSTLIGFLEAIS
jgi:hypothetical protein